MYPAVLMPADSPTKAESAGLMAHMVNVQQVAKNLGGSQRLNYDRTFRKRVAAKNIRYWGELNMPIFCQSLAIQQRSAPSVQPPEFGSKGGWGEPNMPIFFQSLAIQQRSAPLVQPPEFGSKGGLGPAPGLQGCRKWNFVKESCKRAGCKFNHYCYFCGGPHKGPDCPLRAKKNSNRYY